MLNINLYSANQKEHLNQQNMFTLFMDHIEKDIVFIIIVIIIIIYILFRNVKMFSDRS